MKIKRDWAVVAFIALLLSGLSAVKLWTHFPWVPVDGEAEVHAGLDSIMQIYAVSHIGWRGESKAFPSRRDDRN